MIECTKTVSMWLMWASTDHQRFSVLHIRQSKHCIVTSFPSVFIGWHGSEKVKWHAFYPILKMSINELLTILGLASRKIKRAMRRHQPIIEPYAAFLSKNACDNKPTLSSKWASMQCKWLMALHLGKSNGCAATLTHNQTIGCHSRQMRFWQHCYYVLNISVKRASMIVGLASPIIKGLCNDINL